MRILIYTGKGGVGKTSIASATALFLANSEKKVMLISTDQAHSLGDIFNKKINNILFFIHYIVKSGEIFKCGERIF